MQIYIEKRVLCSQCLCLFDKYVMTRFTDLKPYLINLAMNLNTVIRKK